MQVLPMGERAVVVADIDASPTAMAAALRARVGGLIRDVVVGADTVMVLCDHGAALREVVDALDTIEVAVDADATGRLIELDVIYDGADLDEVAIASGLSVDEVIDAHSGATYTVAFVGFAPGFGYLDGLPSSLVLPRRSTPRASVPIGSVAIASTYSAVYPRASPGGWHLLGRTETVLFDPDAHPPTPIEAGATVRFRAR